MATQKVGQRLGFIKVPESSAGAARGGTGRAIHPFDEEYGTDTSGLIFGDDLWSTAYYGVTPSLLTQMIGALNLDWERFTFIDLGSGKGRALLLASRFPFKKIMGVEFVPDLSTVAAANIAKFDPSWKACREIESITGDAAKFEYPEGPLVIYIYNPFLAPVLKKCLKHLSKLLEKEPREVYLIYGNPVFERLVKRYAPRFEQQWDRMFSFTTEEAAVDRFGSKEERVILWKYAYNR
ncbi:SAM-dependent methyltransferase [Edaphobacter albus]|uniref:class I SAM-dependent methyltransferase n=1 Tax=Edaphobacter sp. 4G125 TaxID=2763071 RepID=UPI001646EADC|nr:class I SAM-dependent methyltransferase [Edaphobacter sp. 4G125]QNI37961.1 class I SAM-dependent methyltransferase [Edaphobacter sp. 4G125]